MGLDMYVIKTKDITKDEAEKCKGKKVEDIDKSKFSWFYEEGFEGTLRSHLHKVPCLVGKIDFVKIDEDANMPDTHSRLGNEQDIEGNMTFVYYNDDYKDRREFNVSKEEMERDYVKYVETDVLIGGPLEEFAYWRKHYHLADLIDESCDVPVENCGFYALTKKTLDVISKADPYFKEKLANDHDEDAIYVYHPWW